MATLKDQLAGLAIQVGALSLVVETTLAVANQDIPGFKNRALATLREAIVTRQAQFAGNLNAQVIAGRAVKIFSDIG